MVRQEVLGLILGGTFAILLNLARWLGSFDRVVCGGLVRLFRGLGVEPLAVVLGIYVVVGLACHPERHRAEIDHLFREAAEYYLQGQWNEARRRYERILSMDETDADTLMQLGTLYERVEQPAWLDAAFRQCLELEGSGKWRWEIQQSLARIGEESSS